MITSQNKYKIRVDSLNGKWIHGEFVKRERESRFKMIQNYSYFDLVALSYDNLLWRISKPLQR